MLELGTPEIKLTPKRVREDINEVMREVLASKKASISRKLSQLDDSESANPQKNSKRHLARMSTNEVAVKIFGEQDDDDLVKIMD